MSDIFVAAFLGCLFALACVAIAAWQYGAWRARRLVRNINALLADDPSALAPQLRDLREMFQRAGITANPPDHVWVDRVLSLANLVVQMHEVANTPDSEARSREIAHIVGEANEIVNQATRRV